MWITLHRAHQRLHGRYFERKDAMLPGEQSGFLQAMDEIRIMELETKEQMYREGRKS